MSGTLHVALLLFGAWVLLGSPIGAQPAPEVLSFEQATQRLLDHNPALQAARARARTSSEMADDAARYPNPTFGILEEYTNLEDGGSDDQWFLTLTQPLDYPGETRSLRRSADAVETAASARVQETAAALYQRLRNRYLDVVMAQQRVEGLRRYRDAVDQAARAASVRYQEGDLGTFQNTRLAVAKAQYNNQFADAEQNLDTARRALAALIMSRSALEDRQNAAPRYTVTGTPQFVPVQVDADGALRHALGRRDLLQAVDASLTAAEERLSATRYQQYPRLSVSAGPRRQAVPGATTYGYTAGIQIGLPLWNGGGATVEAQRGRRNAAAADREAARRTVETQVRTAIDRVTNYRDRIQALSHGTLADPDSLLHNALYVYQEGEIGLVALLDAIGAARDAQLLRLDLTAGYLRSLYALEFALGVGPMDDSLLVKGALEPRDASL